MYAAKFHENDLEQLEEGWMRTDVGGKKIWEKWKAVSVEYYKKSPGQSSSFHSHENKQVTIVFKGKLKVYTENQETTLGEMDSVFLSENEVHKMEVEGGTKAVGINIFVPGRAPDFWQNRST